MDSRGKNFYITTTLPYVNAAPHLGHALEFVQADTLARYHASRGEAVFFNTGTDEHGTKVYRKALETGKDPQAYADAHAEKFKQFCKTLHIDYSAFIRTTDAHHKKAAQKIWELCDKNGDIYKGIYKVKYCVGCELEKSESELVGGRCAIHPSLEIELIEEENYFFRWSKYQKPLLDFYAAHLDFVVPSSRFNEIKNFVSAGIQDFSISRMKAKMPWGIPVPGDDDHVMYVWFDALVNYISTLGWPEDEDKFTEFWGTKSNPNALQVAGKDNLRQQSAMWQAMLMSAGLPNSRQIFIHGFVTGEGGVKMSKTLGNVVDPVEVAAKFGVDALRYYLLREVPAAEDGEFSEAKLRDRYRGDLANGLGNFAARVLKLGEDLGGISGGRELPESISSRIDETKGLVRAKIEAFKFHEALAELWMLIGFGDAYVNEKAPWKIARREERETAVFHLITILDNVAALLQPFLPETARKITERIVWNDGILKIKKGEVLFPRLE